MIGIGELEPHRRRKAAQEGRDRRLRNVDEAERLPGFDEAQHARRGRGFLRLAVELAPTCPGHRAR